MRYILFILTNFAVMAVIMFFVQIFGLNQYIAAQGINLTQLAIFSLVIGFSGSIISLLMSKSMAKMSMRVHVIETPANDEERWLVAEIKKLTTTANVGMPEVGIFEGAPNAFATGASKNSSLIAVSTGLLQTMNKDEVRAVLAHEVAHVANGDMVTMALLQGVLNTFVVFLSRVIAFMITSAGRGNNRDSGSSMGGQVTFQVVSVILDMALGFLAHIIAAYFSRVREYRADSGATKLMNNNPQSMIAALQVLKQLSQPTTLPSSFKSFGINGGISNLFSTHPPLDDRIAALRKASGVM